MNLCASELRCDWEDMLSGEDIVAWVSKGANKLLRGKLPTEPGVYRWLFPSDGAEKPSAYIGQGGSLRVRLSPYLNAAFKPITSAMEDSFAEQQLIRGIKRIHGSSVVRIGECLAGKSATSNVSLQRLRITEEGMICGVEISDHLLHEKLGRVFLEHWATLYTEKRGYTILNRNQSIWQKEWRKRRERARKKAAVEGARL